VELNTMVRILGGRMGRPWLALPVKPDEPLSAKFVLRLFSFLRDTQAVAVDPGMDSNHELDRFCNYRNLLILQSRQRYKKHQSHALRTKSVQNGKSPRTCLGASGYADRTLRLRPEPPFGSRPFGFDPLRGRGEG
jgi:hypothetical protein